MLYKHVPLPKNYRNKSACNNLLITNWKIKINESKSSFVNFSLRPLNCPAVTINNIIIPHSTEKLNSRLHVLKPLLRSNLTLPIKIILYKTLLQPIWTYGIVIWSSAKNSNKRTVQVFQNITLGIITSGAPWFVSNETLNSDLKLPSIDNTDTIYYKRFQTKLQNIPNQLIIVSFTNTSSNNYSYRFLMGGLVGNYNICPCEENVCDATGWKYQKYRQVHSHLIIKLVELALRMVAFLQLELTLACKGINVRKDIVFYLETSFCTLKDDMATCDVEVCGLDLMDIAPCPNNIFNVYNIVLNYIKNNLKEIK
ncbi:ribosome biogenesis protein TSR3 isoform X1 [Aphis craccivora]|uniref:Ribosome biogenesis protein TSR3 isoform X1 n=1 Tax=Aphis craccivora TaxID=307492 RepID=A0A6G0Y569_APHCR|nr:ribosome biogenesis protein TSR3 isoform X1 [Aphis craccivora]